MSEQEGVLDRIVLRTRRLYSLPAVASRLLELTSQEHVDPRAIKECIELDPALTAKILRVANSSLFGLRTEVTNLHQAIGLLGIRSLKMLVLGFSLPGELTRDVDSAVLERFWRHTVYRAVAARRLAEHFWQLPADDAFLAGLLNGIGMLALIQDLGATYTQFLDHVYDHGGDLAEQELLVLGFDHAVLSARMLEHWGLPPLLVQGVARPRHLTAILALPPAEQALCAILHMADLAAEFLVTARPAKLQALLHAAAQLKSATADDVRLVMRELEDEVVQLADLFKIARPQSGEFERLFSAAQAGLAEITESLVLNQRPTPEPPEEDPQAVELFAEAADLQRELSRAICTVARRPESDLPVRRPDAPRRSPRSPITATPRVAGESALVSGVVAAVERCRGRRCALSLVMLTVDRYTDVVLEAGPEVAEQFVRWLSRACFAALGSEECVIPVGDARFALILEEHDRNEAASLARGLLDAARRKGQRSSLSPIKISLGVATLALPPRNFPERELIEAARRCLQAAQSSGGDAVKSIEI